jgi:hypothetical protein
LRWIKIWIYICVSTCSFSQLLDCRIWMNISKYNYRLQSLTLVMWKSVFHPIFGDYINGKQLYVWIHPLHLDSLSLICLRLWFRFTLAMLTIKKNFNKTKWLTKYRNLSRVGAPKNNTKQSHSISLNYHGINPTFFAVKFVRSLETTVNYKLLCLIRTIKFILSL